MGCPTTGSANGQLRADVRLRRCRPSALKPCSWPWPFRVSRSFHNDRDPNRAVSILVDEIDELFDVVDDRKAFHVTGVADRRRGTQQPTTERDPRRGPEHGLDAFADHQPLTQTAGETLYSVTSLRSPVVTG